MQNGSMKSTKIVSQLIWIKSLLLLPPNTSKKVQIQKIWMFNSWIKTKVVEKERALLEIDLKYPQSKKQFKFISQRRNRMKRRRLKQIRKQREGKRSRIASITYSATVSSLKKMMDWIQKRKVRVTMKRLQKWWLAKFQWTGSMW